MTLAEVVKLSLALTSVALSVASLFVARRAAWHAQRADAAYARVRAAIHNDAQRWTP